MGPRPVAAALCSLLACGKGGSLTVEQYVGRVQGLRKIANVCVGGLQPSIAAQAPAPAFLIHGPYSDIVFDYKTAAIQAIEAAVAAKRVRFDGDSAVRRSPLRRSGRLLGAGRLGHVSIVHGGLRPVDGRAGPVWGATRIPAGEPVDVWRSGGLQERHLGTDGRWGRLPRVVRMRERRLRAPRSLSGLADGAACFQGLLGHECKSDSFCYQGVCTPPTLLQPICTGS